MAAGAPLFDVDVGSRSIPGSSHDYEDRVLTDSGRGLFAVADGVTISSQGSGGFAAERALAFLAKSFSGDLSAAVAATHEELVRLKAKDRTVGETTLTAVHLRGRVAEVASVGDSPCYLLRGGELRLLAEPDHRGGALTQTIGYPRLIEVHRTVIEAKEGDYIIVASDGVAHVLNRSVLASLAGASPEAGGLAEAIVESAAAAKVAYDDDKSVIVIRVRRVDTIAATPQGSAPTRSPPPAGRPVRGARQIS